MRIVYHLFCLSAMCVREVQSFSQAVPKAFSLTCCSQYSSNVVLSQCCLPNGAGCQTVNTRKCSTDGVLDRYGPENDISKCTVTTNYICPQVCEVNQVIAHTIPSSIINDDYYYTSECQANSNAPCYDVSCWQQCTECNVTEWAESPCTMLSNTVCAPCLPLLWPNTYWNPTLGVCSSSDAWVLCDACTDPEDYENGALLNTCPPPDRSKGRAPDGTCRPCVSCPPNLYYLPPADSTLTCVTKPVQQCTYTYMDQNNVPQTHLPMPFVYGWQRMPGAHNSNVEQNTGDTLPYYKACPPAPAGYVPQTSPPYAGTDWSLDCKYSVVGMCATGYYEAGGCVACPNAPQSAGGFQTFCTCPAGRATMDDLKRAFPNSMVSVVGGMLDQYCFSCTGDVSFWGQDVWTMEYIVCTSSSQIVRCSGREAVNSSGPQCETCPAGSEPTGSRNKCVACGAGAYQAGSECVACDPDTQLCDQAGMTAPLAKTSRCAEGQLLTLNAGSVNDNTCGPCPLNCPLGNTYVWAEGHNQSNPCRQTLADGSQTLYFACYPTDASQPLEVNAQFSNQDYRLVFEAAQNQVLVEPCAAAWLPPNAQWVGNGLQCLWTCKYGWDMAQGAKLRGQIESIIINGTRSDLYDFWMGMRFSRGGLGMQVSTYQKVLWPLFDPVAGVQGSQWEQAYSIGATLAAAESANYYESNTFLYVDEIGAPETLCLPPPLTPEPCPLGFFSTSGGLPCAAYAQANGLYVPSWEGDSNSYYVVLDPSSKSILCSILQSALYTHAWTSYSQCGACLDQNQPITSSRLVLEWRARSSWQSLGVEQPPYGFTQAGVCAGMVCMVGAYLLPEGLACIPCQASSADWASVCGAAQVFDASVCGQPGSDTLADVCQECPDAAGTLGFLTESSALLPQWESQRGKWPASSTVCKYVCAANYTSNPNATAYPDTPCLSCPSQVEGAWASGIKVCVGEGSFYFDWGAQSCGQGEGVDAYVPTCSSCEALVSNLVWAGGEALPTSNAGCLALCDPKTFFTVLVNGSKALTPVPQGLIASCEPCSQAHIVSCSNTSCVAGFYRWISCGQRAYSLANDLWTGTGRTASHATLGAVEKGFTGKRLVFFLLLLGVCWLNNRAWQDQVRCWCAERQRLCRVQHRAAIQQRDPGSEPCIAGASIEHEPEQREQTVDSARMDDGQERQCDD